MGHRQSPQGWAPSNRNDGRHHSGMGGHDRRNPQGGAVRIAFCLLLVFGLAAGKASASARDDALCAAIQRAPEAKIVELLDRGAQVEADCGEATPLIRAVAADRLDVVKLLLDRGADPNAPITRSGFNRPHPALLDVQSVAVANILIEHGANPNFTGDNDRRSALSNVIMTVHDRDLTANSTTIEIVKFLLDHGANVNAVDHDGWSPLMWAVGLKNAELVQLLIDHGASVNQVSTEARSVMDQANLMNAPKDIIDILSENSAAGTMVRNIEPRIRTDRGKEQSMVAHIGIFETDDAHNDFASRANGPGKYYGTAFMISPCLILTSYHVAFPVIEHVDLDRAALAKTRVSTTADSGVFRYGTSVGEKGFSLSTPTYPILWSYSKINKADIAKDPLGAQNIPVTDWVVARLESCSQDRNRADYAVLVDQNKLSKILGEKSRSFRFLGSYSGYPADLQNWQSGKFELYTQNNCRIDTDMSRLTSDCKSYHGASGSPVYVKQGAYFYVFGIVSRAVDEDKLDQNNRELSLGDMKFSSVEDMVTRERVECNFSGAAIETICGDIISLTEADFAHPMNAAEEWCSAGHEGMPDVKTAIKACRDQIAIDGRSAIDLARLYFYLAEFELLSGADDRDEANQNFKRAMASASQAIGSGADAAVGHQLLCMSASIGNIDTLGAMEDCDKAVSLARDAPLALIGRGIALIRLGRYDEAAADLDEAVAKHPKSGLALYLRGLDEVRRGKRSEGLADIKQAEQLNPGIARRYASFELAP